jgi:predicted aspartyl protease
VRIFLRLFAFALFVNGTARAAALQIAPGAYTSGKVYVTCLFDGVKEKCLLDTGSAMTLLADSKRFGNYTNLGVFRFKSASGIPQETETIQIGSIQIDDVAFTSVKIGRATFQNAENTLGMDLIARQPFVLNFKSKPTLQLGAPRPHLPLTTLNVFSQGLPSIPISLNGSEVHALWDTGAALTVIDQDFIARRREDFKPTRNYMNGVDGAGHNLLLQMFRAKKITIGDATFEDVRVVAADLSVLREANPDIHAVVGFNLIRKANWFFDAKNRLWKCER